MSNMRLRGKNDTVKTFYWLAERCELYIRPMKDLLDTAGKEQHRGKLNCVRLALINAIFSHQTAWMK